MLRRRFAPWLLGSFALAGAVLLFDCVGAEPPIPATGGDAATDGTTVESGADTSMGGEAGGMDADAAASDTGSDAEGGAVVDVVVHDGPKYHPPTETTTDISDGGGIYNQDPAIAVGGTTAVVVLDAIGGGTGFLQSTNGAVSFNAPGSFTTGTVNPTGYPSVARDSVNGNVYVATLGIDSTTSSFNRIGFLTSSNGGASFTAAVNAADPALTSSDFTDVPWIAVDNATGAGQGAVYFTYTRYGATADVHVTAYNQGSYTYTTPASPASPDQASLSTIAVGPNHFVYVVYYGATAGNPYVGFVKSTNQGANFSAPVTVAPLHMPFVAGQYNGNLGLSGEGTDGGATPVELYASPQVVANPMTGSVYVAYADATQGADKANIYFVHSEDTGATWSTPVQVNDDTTTHDQFLPAIAVTPDGTRLAIDFYDRRNDPANLAAYRYGATATIGAAGKVTFDPNFKVSQSQFPVLTYEQNQGYFSIHTGMAADSTYFYDSFSTAAGTTEHVVVARYGVLY
jgi:hypothetical protein